MRFHAFRCLLPGACILLVACTGSRVPTSPQPSVPVAESPATILPMPEPAAPVMNRPANPAVESLLAQAGRQQARADFAAASSLLERAVRIAPQEPAAYQALARLRLDQNQPREAEQLALKAANLPGLSTAERVALWQLVADCRDQQGDASGAEAARAQARQWE